jgi:hypothetical protein
MILATGLLVLVTSLSAQITSIDLIPSSHQIRPHAAIIDTSSALDSLVQKTIDTWTPADLEKNASRESIKKERRQIGPSMDSLFRKAEARNARPDRRAWSISLHSRKFNPVKFFISIIALK